MFFAFVSRGKCWHLYFTQKKNCHGAIFRKLVCPSEFGSFERWDARTSSKFSWSLKWLFSRRVIRHNMAIKILYRSTWLNIIITGLRVSAGVTEIKFFLIIFLPKSYMPIAFWTIISIICYLNFHYQIISFWYLYPGVMSHLKSESADTINYYLLTEFDANKPVVNTKRLYLLLENGLALHL